MAAADVDDVVPPPLDSADLRASSNEHGEDLTAAQAWCIYVSHALSMWNSRIYEYANVLFAQHTFPGSLLPTSLIGISETICMITVSAALGAWIDGSSNRLRPLLTSIIINRVTLGLCCLLWLVIALIDATLIKQVLFGAVLVLGMVEKTTRMSNMLSVERDWIPTLAATSPDGELVTTGYSLTHLNTIVRRIDISCKFVAPLAASGLMAVFASHDITVPVFIGGFSIASVGIEVASVVWVWDRNSRIRASKKASRDSSGLSVKSQQPWLSWSTIRDMLSNMLPAQVAGLKFYFSTSVWIPSFGVALLHASILDWAGTLITWLLNAGFTYGDITIAKGVGTIFEVGSTFVFPVAVAFFAQRMSGSTDRGSYQMVSKTDDNDKAFPEEDLASPTEHRSSITTSSLAPVIEAGKYGLASLLAMLIPAVIALFILDSNLSQSNQSKSPSPTDPSPLSAFSRAPLSSSFFFAFLSLSFLGRWVYDLAVTQLTQCSVAENQRSVFGGAEMAVVAAFQFAHWLASAIFSDQADFKWLGLMSVLAVGLATGAAWKWYREWDGREKVLDMGNS